MASGKEKISAAAGPATGGAAATEEKKADPKDQDEEADIDMGAGGLFGEEDEY